MRAFRTRQRRSRIVLAFVCAVALSALTFPASAAAVTIKLGPPDLSASDPFAGCDQFLACTKKTFVPTSLPEPGATLISPADGRIVSWRVKGKPPKKLHLRVVQAIGDGRFTGIATSGAAGVTDGQADNQVLVAIGAGQQIGLDLESEAPASSLFGNSAVPGAAWSEFSSGLADGSTAAPTVNLTDSEPLFNATVVLFKPLIFNMTSSSGPESGGDIVIVNGVHLAKATSVTFGDAPANILAASNTQMMVSAPPHAPGAVAVFITTAGGSSDDSAVSQYTYMPVGPSAPDTVAPQLTDFSIDPTAFRAETGARVAFRTTEAGSVRFTVQRKPANGRGSLKTLGGSRTLPTKLGANKLRFAASLNGRALRPGRYRLVAIATDAAANRSNARRRAFEIVR